MKSDLLSINTVQEWFEWRRDSKLPSVEDYNKVAIHNLKWEYSDVLYSFLGVYVIGVWIFYPEKFKQRGCSLYDGNKRIYSFNFMCSEYNKYTDLNDLQELKNFLNNYFSIGNICPIWPGGNAHRGRSQCFDIPDIYFKRNEKWTNYLMEVYPQAYLDNIIDSKNEFCANGNTNIFLENIIKGGRKTYEKFLNHITTIICERERKLCLMLNSGLKSC